MKGKKGRVVHCKHEAFDVYIGRPGPWGNPFTLTNEANRQEVIKKYRTWLRAEIKEGRIEEGDVLNLYGKTLGCWCAPKACHGDVLLEEASLIKESRRKK